MHVFLGLHSNKAGLVKAANAARRKRFRSMGPILFDPTEGFHKAHFNRTLGLTLYCWARSARSIPPDIVS
jgi:hypothetical protein